MDLGFVGFRVQVQASRSLVSKVQSFQPEGVGFGSLNPDKGLTR